MDRKSSDGTTGFSGNLVRAIAEPELPGFPPAELHCRHCGQLFPTARVVGRPQAFCSPICRQDHAVNQRRAWVAEHAASEDPAAVCKSCGATFIPPPRRSGRAPGFCSPECRAAGRKVRAASYRARRRRIRTGEIPQPDIAAPTGGPKND